jgi:acyl-coenzyme A thioesterase 13
MSQNKAEIPEGFRRVQRPRPNPFNDRVGPFYERRRGDQVSLGLRIEARHTNSRGICHGGLLATLADLALGYSALAVGGPDGNKRSFVTVSLSLDFSGSARVGDWVESEVAVQKTGARLAFANGYLVANGVRIVRASAIFALSGNRAEVPVGASPK